MKIITRSFVLTVSLFCAAGYADVVNGSINHPIILNAETINVCSAVDRGWFASSAALYDLSQYDIWSTGLMNQSGYWFGQIYSDHSATQGRLMFGFDVTYLGANIKSAMFLYAIYGTDSADIAGTDFALNTDLEPAGSDWKLVGEGTVAVPDEGSYQSVFDAGASSYRYLAVRGRFTGTTSGRGTDYATAVDNISVRPDHSPVPEPAAVSMIGIGAAVALILARSRRGN